MRKRIKGVVLGGLCVAALVLSAGAQPASASFERTRRLHVTKECSEYTGAAGSWCTITVSNIGRLPVGSKVLYSQAAGVPAGLLNSNCRSSSILSGSARSPLDDHLPSRGESRTKA